MSKSALKISFLLLIFLVLIIGTILYQSLKPHSLERWYHGSQSVILDKTDEVLLIDGRTFHYEGGQSLDGGRAKMTFSSNDCLYEMIINDEESASFKTVLGSVCPYYDWSIKKK